MRRFTRLTNCFSRKLANHAADIARYMLSYNFVKIHGTLKTTPAYAAGVVDRPLSFEELVEEFDGYRAAEYPVNRPRRYKKRARTVPKTFEPRKPKTPWYLDPDNPESQARYDEIVGKD